MKSLKDQIADLKREQIVRVAGELFYSQGYTRTSMDDIASALSIGKPMIYSYFPSKIALLVAVCNETSHMIANLATSITELQNQTPAQRLRTIIYQASLQVLERSKPLTVLLREVRHLPPSSLEELKESDTRFRAVMIDILRQGKAAGEFHYDADDRIAAQSISGMVTWPFTWYRKSGPLSAEEVADNIAIAVLQMVGCTAAKADCANNSIQTT